MENRDERQPLRLLWVFVFGFIFSLTLIGGFFLLFAAQAADRWDFWAAEPPLGQDRLFGAVRNAVTLAAALGVGITLFFSYRKQQTAEQAQDLAVKAQTLAFEAQTLATRTLQLSLDKHDLERVSELRNRYARSAEQLGSDKNAIQLAGLHSLASLADDWVEIGNNDEQQVCISLICSFASSADRAPFQGTEQPPEAASRVIASRLRVEDPEDKKWWGSKDIVLSSASLRSGLSGAQISGGAFSAIRTQWRGSAEIRLEDGKVLIAGNISDNTFPSRISGAFLGGGVTLNLSVGEPPKGVEFLDCRFEGSKISMMVIPDTRAVVVFRGCTFKAGNLDIWPWSEKVDIHFLDCTFEAPGIATIKDPENDPPTIEFKNCKFLGEAKTMESNPVASMFA